MMNKIKDIEGNELQAGDSVLCATTGFGAKALLVKGTITKITDVGNVKIKPDDYEKAYKSSLLSTNPERQIALIESRTRKVLTEKNN
jgi:uncharacterized Zn ribbon protein